jgi:putative transposase
LYLLAVIDWASSTVLSWRVSNRMEVEFCIAAVAYAMQRFDVPGTFNTDKGSQSALRFGLAGRWERCLNGWTMCASSDYGDH